MHQAIALSRTLGNKSKVPVLQITQSPVYELGGQVASARCEVVRIREQYAKPATSCVACRAGAGNSTAQDEAIYFTGKLSSCSVNK